MIISRNVYRFLRSKSFDPEVESAGKGNLIEVARGVLTLCCAYQAEWYVKDME